VCVVNFTNCYSMYNVSDFIASQNEDISLNVVVFACGANNSSMLIYKGRMID